MDEPTFPKPFAFVLMPFSAEFNDVYTLGIKAACHEAGAYCERVDEQIFTESILDRIYNQISKADIIVSDMSTRNPNVFYETGYAHALGKQVILLTQRADDIPFDMKHYPHIIYSSITHLKVELKRRVEWCIENPKRLLPEIDFLPSCYIQGQKLESKSTINLPASVVESDTSSFALFDFSLELHNASKRIYDLSHYQLAIIGDWETRLSLINSEIDAQDRYGLQQEKQNEGYYIHKKIIPPSYTDNNIMALPNNTAMFVFPVTNYKILPEGWYTFKSRLVARFEKAEQIAELFRKECTIRFFSELGTTQDIEFSLILKRSPINL